MTEELARALETFLKRFDETPYPVVLSIPSGKGESGYGDEILKKAMERALGRRYSLRGGRRKGKRAGQGSGDRS